MTDPKTVEGEEVVFSESSQHADKRDEDINSSNNDINAQNIDNSANKKNPKNYREKNAEILCEELTRINYFTSLKPNALKIVPYCVYIKAGYDTEHFTFDIGQINTQLLCNFLERKDFYGPEIKNTGIYEELELNTSIYTDIGKTLEFFPEFQEIIEYGGRSFKKIDNSYLTTLQLGIVDYRLFLVGAINEAISQDKFRDSGSNVSLLPKKLTTLDILNYAKKVNEVPNVAKIVKEYHADNF